LGTTGTVEPRDLGPVVAQVVLDPVERLGCGDHA
jgi:hypothetical protein